MLPISLPYVITFLVSRALEMNYGKIFKNFEDEILKRSLQRLVLGKQQEFSTALEKQGSLSEKGRKITGIYIISQTNHERNLSSLTFIRDVCKKHNSTNLVAFSLPGDLFSSSPAPSSSSLLRTICYEFVLLLQ